MGLLQRRNYKRTKKGHVVVVSHVGEICKERVQKSMCIMDIR